MLAKVGHALSYRPRRTDVICELNDSLNELPCLAFLQISVSK